MRDSKRIKPIIKKLEEAWNIVPDWRWGQFISNLLGPGPQDVFYLDDDQLEILIDLFIKNNRTVKPD